MGLHNVYQSANKRKTNCARQRSEHIDAPKFAMSQPKRGLPFGNRCGNKIRLPKTGKVREHESAGDPTEIAPYEFKHGIFILRTLR
jgi:hypothetical protein